ncbi:DDE-type integrase/transposase/recombinase [Candidatus Poribacteria bacterium]|nr:DDE-type integrase/transposase/recombinase [Candidatus Poribacteria bacterium]
MEFVVPNDHKNWESKYYKIGCCISRELFKQGQEALDDKLFSEHPEDLKSEGFRKRIRITHFGEQLLCRRRKSKLRTTDSHHGFCIYANLAGTAEVTGVNQLWASDITYIGLPDEYIYLASVIDVYSRKCVGWHIGNMYNQKRLHSLSVIGGAVQFHVLHGAKSYIKIFFQTR